ncbi:MAG: hypothetical protein IJP03_01365, partial [Christensenellaceae bacterium]|nr:hypothetical protein [Christensenellaceae bacterium]
MKQKISHFFQTIMDKLADGILAIRRLFYKKNKNRRYARRRGDAYGASSPKKSTANARRKKGGVLQAVSGFFSRVGLSVSIWWQNLKAKYPTVFDWLTRTRVAIISGVLVLCIAVPVVIASVGGPARAEKAGEAALIMGTEAAIGADFAGGTLPAGSSQLQDDPASTD